MARVLYVVSEPLPGVAWGQVRHVHSDYAHVVLVPSWFLLVPWGDS